MDLMRKKFVNFWLETRKYNEHKKFVLVGEGGGKVRGKIFWFKKNHEAHWTFYDINNKHVLFFSCKSKTKLNVTFFVYQTDSHAESKSELSINKCFFFVLEINAKKFFLSLNSIFLCPTP